MIFFVWLMSFAHAEREMDSVTEQINWWSTWSDPQLATLLEQGLKNSPDAKIAWARLEQSKAAAGQARAGFLPSLSASVTTMSQPSDALGFGFGINIDDLIPDIPGQEVVVEEDTSIFTSATMALNLNVPLDIYGSNYAVYTAGQKDALATEQDRINAMRQLSFGIGNSYYDLILVQTQKQIIEEQRQITSNLLETTEAKHERGEASILDVLQQRQQLSAMESQLIQVKQMEQVSEYQLAFLLGEEPGFEAQIGTELPKLSSLHTSDFDAWIAQRPDVQAATFRLDSAEKRKYNAVTKILPAVGVGGKLSRQANSQDDENDAWDTLNAWSISSSVSLTLFQGGAQMERVRAASAGVVIAEESLRKAKLQAELELKQSLLGEQTQEELLIATQNQTDDAMLAYQEAQRQYSQGLTPFVSVMNTRKAAQQAKLTLEQQHRSMIKTRFQTYMTLGYSEAQEQK